VVFIVRDAKELSRPDPAAKLIKARDFWVFKDAERALADAHDEKRRILRSARDAYEAERERGYAEGNEAARLQQSGRMIEIVNQTVDYFTRLEADMVELVLDAVRKVVSDFDDRQRLTTVVKNCLDLLRHQKQLSLSVHPSQVAFLRSQVKALCEQYPNVAQIDVHGDSRLAIDACLVESDIGVVEASLSGQVEVLKQTLNAVIAPVVSQDAATQAIPPDAGGEALEAHRDEADAGEDGDGEDGDPYDDDDDGEDEYGDEEDDEDEDEDEEEEDDDDEDDEDEDDEYDDDEEDEDGYDDEMPNARLQGRRDGGRTGLSDGLSTGRSK
jgi:type III secretion protein L